ncbi:MAG: IS21 family transposase, partial [Pseudomonadota bacterium]
AVQRAERWILATLRTQTFVGHDELNAAIRPMRDASNAKTTRHLGASRRAAVETIDQTALNTNGP